MGQLEETPVKIIESELSQTKDSLVLRSKVDGRRIEFQADDGPYLVLLKSGQTLRHIVSSLRVDLRNFSFHIFFRVIDILCLNGFIKNENDFKSFLDESRTPYLWPDSAVKDGILSARLLNKFSLGRSLWPLSVLLSMVLVFYGTLSGSKLFGLELSRGFLISEGSYLKALVLIFLFNSLMLSIRTVVRCFLLFLNSGWFPALYLKMSFIGIFIDAKIDDPLSKPAQQLSSLLAIFSSFLVLLFAPQVLSTLSHHFVPIELKLQNDILFMFFIVLLVELSPFVKSDFTRSLMILYNLRWDNLDLSFGPSIYKAWDKNRDQIIYFVHFAGIILWLTLLGICFVQVITLVPKDLVEVFKSENLRGPLSSFALLVLLILFFGGLIFEVISSFTYSGPASGFRRFWLMRQARLGQLEEMEMKLESPQKFLAEIPPFNQLDEKILSEIAKDADFKDYSIGYFLCEQGRDTRDMFVILSGRVGVYHKQSMGRRRKVLELGTGATLGEVGFFKGGLRTADVVALTHIRVLKVRFNSEYRHWFLDDQKFQFLQDRMWLMQTLMTSKLFKDVPVEALDLFVRVGSFIDRPPHQIIVSEGEEPDGFYIIVQGHCLVTQKGEYVRELHRGDVFGEIGLLLNRTRTASVMSKEPTKLLKVSKEDFWGVLSENINLGLLLERVAIARLASDQIRSESKKT